MPSYPAHHFWRNFLHIFMQYLLSYFVFEILPCYKLVLNLVMLRSYCIPASQRCPKEHLDFSSQRLKFKYKLTGITF